MFVKLKCVSPREQNLQGRAVSASYIKISPTNQSTHSGTGTNFIHMRSSEIMFQKYSRCCNSQESITCLENPACWRSVLCVQSQPYKRGHLQKVSFNFIEICLDRPLCRIISLDCKIIGKGCFFMFYIFYKAEPIVSNIQVIIVILTYVSRNQ